MQKEARPTQTDFNRLNPTDAHKNQIAWQQQLLKQSIRRLKKTGPLDPSKLQKFNELD